MLTAVRRRIALVGPTATGKTALSIRLAPRFEAEVLACDSMTIYRGMDVGTAKPGARERAAVRHHLLDVADPLERFSVARFQEHAREALSDLAARGKRPFVVGGSGLYFRALVDDLRFPPFDAGVRARLEQRDAASLSEELRSRDPVAAAFVDPANKRRVVRALEVIELTGEPFSSFRSDWERRAPVVAAGLRVPPEELHRRIDERLRAQVEQGLFDEVRALVRSGYRDALTATQAVPYREALAYVDGEIDLEGFTVRAASANRRLARRQLSWFGRDPRVRWFDATDLERAEAEVTAYYGEHLEGDA